MIQLLAKGPKISDQEAQLTLESATLAIIYYHVKVATGRIDPLAN